MAFHNAHAARIEDGIGLVGKWLDTSYTGSRRGKYAGVGDRYDAVADIFVASEVPAVDPAA